MIVSQYFCSPFYVYSVLDVWLTACMVFLFAALIEFAIVNSLARYELRKMKKEDIIHADDIRVCKAMCNQFNNSNTIVRI